MISNCNVITEVINSHVLQYYITDKRNLITVTCSPQHLPLQTTISIINMYNHDSKKKLGLCETLTHTNYKQCKDNIEFIQC